MSHIFGSCFPDPSFSHLLWRAAADDLSIPEGLDKCERMDCWLGLGKERRGVTHTAERKQKLVYSLKLTEGEIRGLRCF